MVNTGEDLAIKIDKVIKSVKEAEKDPEVQRTCLRLEEAPEITKDLNRGKGLVFDYSQKVDDQKKQLSIFKPKKLMADAFKSNSTPVRISLGVADAESSGNNVVAFFTNYSTVFKPGTSGPRVSGIVKKRNNTRKRPSKSARKPRKGGATNEVMAAYTAQREGKQTMGNKKRKNEDQGEEGRSKSKESSLQVIPSEGSPNPQ